MVEVYKKFTKQDIESRSITKLEASESAVISNILGNFVDYFKAKHF